MCGRLACASRHRQMRIKMMPCFISSFPHRGFYAAEPHASWPTGTGSVLISLVVKSMLFCWGRDATFYSAHPSFDSAGADWRLQQRRLQLAAVACHTANTDGSADGWNKISAVWVGHSSSNAPVWVQDSLAFLRKLVNSLTPWQLKEPDLCLSGSMSTVAAHFLLTFFFFKRYCMFVGSYCMILSSVFESEFYEDAKEMSLITWATSDSKSETFPSFDFEVLVFILLNF